MSAVFAWLSANLATILICMGLIAVVTLIIVSMIRDKRKGKSSCGCNCAGCALNGSCHPSNPQKKDTD